MAAQKNSISLPIQERACCSTGSAHTFPDEAVATESISGWGRLRHPGRIIPSTDLERDSRDAVLFRGLGRSYGDSAIPPPSSPVVVATPLADKIRFFDRSTGLIRAEAGLSLL